MNICSSRPAERPSAEKNDCTVIALHYTTGLPYAACRAIAADAGRKTGHGFNLNLLFADCAKRGLHFERVGLPKHALNVAGLTHFFPSGVYYVHVEYSGRRTHAIALVNGIIHDPACAGNTAVIEMWKYIGTRHSSADSMFD